jgi:BirA family transcriptional regulator, biotin operon repressor / biotin---[acetyl-CoA-carboxylase] ligase
VAQSFRSLVIDQVGSTSREALALVDAGETGPLWIMARRQTAGRGRADRQWVSAPGNLHASLILSLSCPPTAVPQLSLLAGVATFDAIRQAAGGRPASLRLKWPNDILIGQAKCAGILAESVAGPQSTTAIIGIGIDLVWHPTAMHRAATDLAEHGCHIEPDAMLASLAEAMQRWVVVWDGGRDFHSIRRAWLERAGPIGEMCTVDTGRERLEGAFADLDADGALIISDSHGRRRTVTFGDVALMGPRR